MTDKVRWGPGRRAEFLAWSYNELERSFSARSQLENDWRRWLQQYRAPIAKGEAHFPFEGAAQDTIPYMAMNADPILARYMANIHAPPNLWTLAPLNERWLNTAKPLQDYLQWMDRRILKMWNVNYQVFMEMIKLGTGIYKTIWRFEQRRKIGYDEQKRRTRLIETINQPAVYHVSLADFLLPPEARHIDPDEIYGAQWVAQRHRKRPSELRAMARGQEPFLPNFDSAAVEAALSFEEAANTEHQQKIEELDNLGASTTMQQERPIEFWEIHTRFDSSGNGIEDDLVVFVHHKTNVILRATYATSVTRPFDAVRYLRGDGFYGVGVGEQSEVFQTITSRFANFNTDRILLSYSPMLGIKEGANVIADEPIFPGKQWHLTNPKEDLIPFHLLSSGQFDISTQMAFFDEMGKRRLGVSDLQQSNIGALPSRTPATTVQSLLQEGNTRFDLSIKDMRLSGLGEVGLKILQLLQQQAIDPINNPDAQQYVQLAPMILGMPEGAYAAQALTVPSEAIETGIGVELTATSGTSNKEMMRQSKLALLQLVTQMAPGFIQLAQVAQQAGGTPLGEIALAFLRGGQELLADTLEQFDIRNPEDILPNIQAIFSSQAQMAGGGQISPMANPLAGGMSQGAGIF